MKNNHLFIAGIPGCGKSSFGQWLQKNKDYVHIDMEHDGLDLHGVREAWESFYSSKNPDNLISFLKESDRPLVLDWGFPPSLFPVVQRIKDTGIKLAWFDGDRLGARSLFKNRNTVPVDQFDKQFARISEHWTAIEDIFEHRIFKIVQPDGIRFSDDTIYTHVFGEFP